MPSSATKTPAVDPALVAAVRSFNRFYTRQIGTLEEGLLQTSFSLTEARVLYEIAERKGATATEIADELAMDTGYLSRILKAFEKADLIERRPAPADRRQSLLSVTAKGRRQSLRLNQRSNEQVGAMLAPLTPASQAQLVSSMSTIEKVLKPDTTLKVPYILRDHRPGDIGWIIERHGTLYAREYGWDSSFEALVARIAADFIEKHSPKDEACWIADRNGERLGSVMLVREHNAKRIPTARLRLLIVDPAARGLGLGRALVQQCHSFARSVGYRRMVLWTNSVLDAARHIYESEGYRLMSENSHTSFGKELTGQNWQLDL